jgi:type IV pilus assembly protein PilE
MKKMINTAKSTPAAQLGFTLIELMIAVVIVGILAAVALPAYGTYVKKGRRVDAKTALLDLAAREEKYFAVNNIYTTSLSDLGITSAYVNGTAATAYYTLSIAPVYATGTTTPIIGFQATATATSVGNQSADTCKNFVLDYLGTQTVTGTATGCW